MVVDLILLLTNWYRLWKIFNKKITKFSVVVKKSLRSKMLNQMEIDLQWIEALEVETVESRNDSTNSDIFPKKKARSRPIEVVG